jgi:uroporphyrinogen decarboxylase
VDRTPVWLMRQAGRALPEYRVLKEKFSFLQLVQTPELAAEVTLQPIRRFDFDAAILFSDILVAAEGLGQKYRFDENGIQMDSAICNADDIARLDVNALREKLDYIPRALQLVKKSLGEKTALIGFAGSPWALANFMLEGGSVKEFTKAKTLFDSDKKTFCALMEKLAAAAAKLLQMQIDAGADAVQIFDSLAGLLPQEHFQEASARWIKQIISQLHSPVPVIVFSRGQNSNWPTLIETGANILGIDALMKLADVRKILPPSIGVQGNLEPKLLTTTPKKVAEETNRILAEMRGARGHIFNLGHGITPEVPPENVAVLVDAVHELSHAYHQ